MIPVCNTCLRYQSTIPVHDTCLQCLSAVPVYYTCPQYLSTIPVCNTCLRYLSMIPVHNTCLLYLSTVPVYYTCLPYLSTIPAYDSFHSQKSPPLPSVASKLIVTMMYHKHSSWINMGVCSLPANRPLCDVVWRKHTNGSQILLQ